MKRYTTALDNLVDDWRRSANLRSSTASLTSTSSALTDVGASPARQVLSRRSRSLHGTPWHLTLLAVAAQVDKSV
jgi:hypothetical protein